MNKLSSGIAMIAAAAIAVSGSMLTAGAEEIKYEAPIDDVSAWVASTGDVQLDSDDSWMDARIEDGSLIVSQNDKVQWFPPYIKVKDPEKGLFEAAEGDILNIKASYVADESLENSWAHTWGMVITFAATEDGTMIDANINAAIAREGGVEISSQNNIFPGSVDTSIDLAAAVKEGRSEEAYESIYGEGGDPTVVAIRLYISTGQVAPGAELSISELSVEGAVDSSGSGMDTSETGDTGSVSSSASSAAGDEVRSENGASGGGASSQVGTGENVFPIIAITALAVVAGVTVAISRKKVK